jgi:hypothetical protein
MSLRHAGAAYGDADSVPTRVARIGVDGWLVISIRRGVMVAFDRRRMLVLVCRRPVVMVRMIVADVLVYMQRRGRGRQ